MVGVSPIFQQSWVPQLPPSILALEVVISGFSRLVEENLSGGITEAGSQGTHGARARALLRFGRCWAAGIPKQPRKRLQLQIPLASSAD